MKPRVIFLGSGAIALPALRWLSATADWELQAVVTQPDRPAGRGLTTREAPVKQFAISRGLPLLQPPRLRDPHSIEELSRLQPDLLVVMAYGQILPRAVLDLPRLGALNLHASLLPKHRGAAPVHAAVLAGDSESGITVMYMDEGLDTGDLLLARSCPVHSDDTAGTLHDRLAELAPAALGEALALIADDRAPRVPQDSAQATYAPRLSRAAGVLDWREPAEALERRVRGLHPWPGTSTVLPLTGGRTMTVKLHRVSVVNEIGSPGEVLHAAGDRLVVACSQGALGFEVLQPPGGRKMSAAEYLRGHAVAVGGQAGGPADQQSKSSA